jgi:uncharacterized protein (TIRG00374 family)
VAISTATRRGIQITIGLGLSVVLLYYSVRGISWQELTEQLAIADYTWLPTVVIVGVYVLFVRAQRWKLLLEQATGRSLPIMPIFSANAIGFMANMLLPLRAGEIARPLLLSVRAGIPVATVLATAVLERVLDLMALVVISMWMVTVVSVPEEVTAAIWTAGVLLIVMVGGLVLVHLQRERLLPVIDRIWAALPENIGGKIAAMEHRFLDDLAVIGDVSVLVRAVLWSFYIWFLIAMSFSFGFWVADIDVPFFQGGVTVMALVAFVVAAPAAPGFFGTFEIGCKLALSDVYGVADAKALGYTVIMHATTFVVQVVLGLVFLVREGLSLGEVGRMGKGGEGPAADRQL